ncbi:hypothetical protein GWI33_017819 [Rhynchophorus ferrugineus]|uniref:Uncharacterized protein n=1 Tax=Rhynchophorus ferrugineus TaxID=354439 RepID=A0A834M8Q0_RHYFE|nr:hypothetical protein GWI33_017819 [Rhynchophorus ferrugineus]
MVYFLQGQSLVLFSFVSILLISLISREVDIRRTHYDNVGNDDEDDERCERRNLLYDSLRKSLKYACYVKYAYDENFECSMQCLQYLYQCG